MKRPNLKNLCLAILPIVGFAFSARAVKLCLGTPTAFVSGISVSCGASSINVGSTTSCNANVSPSNATNKVVSWSSSSPGVASVNSGGTVTGVTAGGATIYATSTDGTNISGSYGITINQPGCGNSCPGGGVCSSCLTSICSSGFINNGCGGSSATTGQDATFTVTGCPSGSVYGRSKCATWETSSGGGAFGSWGTPSNDNGSGCWCRICSNSSINNCGSWVFSTGVGSANGVSCATNCAKYCSEYIYQASGMYGSYPDFRRALCNVP